MGYYIPGPTFGKADYIVAEHNGVKVDKMEAIRAIADSTKAVIACFTNASFDAALFCYDSSEFDAATYPGDKCPITFVVMERQLAKQLSNCPRP